MSTHPLRTVARPPATGRFLRPLSAVAAAASLLCACVPDVHLRTMDYMMDGGQPRTDPARILWLRADLGVASDDGVAVSVWGDQSDSHNDATAPAAERRPAHVADESSGWPVIRFTGSQYLKFAFPVRPTSFTILVVGRNRGAANLGGEILGPGGNWPNNQVRWEGNQYVLLDGESNALPEVVANIGDTRVLHILTMRYDGSQLSFYRNGQFISHHDFITTGPFILAQIGAWYATYFLDGDLAEIMVYDGALPVPSLDQIVANLKSRYQLR